MTTTSSSAVTITESAANKVRELLAGEGRAEQGLRLYVTGGGCAGYSYGLAFDDGPRDGDAITEYQDVRIFVDSWSAPLVMGAEIDYNDGLMGAGFTIHNPQAVSSCGCGHSFSAGEGEGAQSESAGGGCGSGGCGSHSHGGW